MFGALEALLRTRMSLPLLGDVPHPHSFYSETYILVSIVSQSKSGLFNLDIQRLAHQDDFERA